MLAVRRGSKDRATQAHAREFIFVTARSAGITWVAKKLD